MARESNPIRLVVKGVVILALLAWGVFAVVTVYTAPSSPQPYLGSSGGIANLVLRGATVSYELVGPYRNGTTISPGTVARFGMLFEASPVYNASRGWPQSGSIPGGQGVTWGPFLPSQPTSSSSSFEVHYAIFTFSFSVPELQGWNLWFTGPGGTINQPTYEIDTPSVGARSPTSGFTIGPATWILEIQTPGNYTLNYSNGVPANATGHVIMSFSSVTFAPSRPFLYPGLVTIAIASVFATETGLGTWKKRGLSQANSSKPANPFGASNQSRSRNS